MTFSIVAIIISISLLIVFLKSTAHSRFDWINAAKHPLLVVPNDLIFLSIIAPLSFSLLDYKKSNIIMSIVAATSILLTACVIILFQSRGALLTFIFSIACVAGLLWPKRLIISAILLLSIAVLVDMTQNFVLLNRFLNDSFGRTRYWLIAWQMFLDAPVFGQGIHTFWVFLKTYSQAINVPVGATSWVHNLYIETLAEQGIVGFTSLIGVLISSFWASWQTQKTKQQDIRILSMGALAAMLGFCLAAFSEITFIRYWCVTIFFSLLAIITVLLL